MWIIAKLTMIPPMPMGRCKDSIGIPKSPLLMLMVAKRRIDEYVLGLIVHKNQTTSRFNPPNNSATTELKRRNIARSWINRDWSNPRTVPKVMPPKRSNRVSNTFIEGVIPCNSLEGSVRRAMAASRIPRTPTTSSMNTKYLISFGFSPEILACFTLRQLPVLLVP